MLNCIMSLPVFLEPFGQFGVEIAVSGKANESLRDNRFWGKQQ